MSKSKPSYIDQLVSMTLDGVPEPSVECKVLDFDKYFETREKELKSESGMENQTHDSFNFNSMIEVTDLGLPSGVFKYQDNLKYSLGDLEIPKNLDAIKFITNDLEKGALVKTRENEIAQILSMHLGVDVFAIGFINIEEGIEFYLLDTLRDVLAFKKYLDDYHAESKSHLGLAA